VSWFTLAEHETGQLLSPLEATPARPLRLTPGGALRLARCEGHAQCEPSAEEDSGSWKVTPRGPFALVFNGVEGHEVVVRFDDVVPLEVHALREVEPTEEAISDAPALDEGTPALDEGTPAPTPPFETMGPWDPRAFAVRMLASPSRIEGLYELALRTVLVRREISGLFDAPRTCVAPDLGALLLANFVETGRVPGWAREESATRSQRLIHEATLACVRSRLAMPEEPEPGAVTADIESLLGMLRTSAQAATPVVAAEIDAALSAAVLEMESIAATLRPLAQLLAIVRTSPTHEADLRAALVANEAIRALARVE
jgi:hypothetical protein